MFQFFSVYFVTALISITLLFYFFPFFNVQGLSPLFVLSGSFFFLFLDTGFKRGFFIPGISRKSPPPTHFHSAPPSVSLPSISLKKQQQGEKVKAKLCTFGQQLLLLLLLKSFYCHSFKNSFSAFLMIMMIMMSRGPLKDPEDKDYCCNFLLLVVFCVSYFFYFLLQIPRSIFSFTRAFFIVCLFVLCYLGKKQESNNIFCCCFQQKKVR